jgi:hypothetical protein
MRTGSTHSALARASQSLDPIIPGTINTRGRRESPRLRTRAFLAAAARPDNSSNA